MSDYTLHQGTGIETRFAEQAAIKSASAKNSIINDNHVPVVLSKIDPDKNSVEFAGYKSKGDHQPMTVTSMFINGTHLQLNAPIEVTFIQSREGEGILKGTLNNLANAPINKDAGKLTKESGETLDEICGSVIKAQQAEKDKSEAVLVKPADGAPFTDVTEQEGPGEALNNLAPPIETGRAPGK